MRCLSPLLLLALLALACGGAPAGEQEADRGPLRITVDPATRHQEIHGWGTCLITWKPELRQLYNRTAFVDFYANELGCNMLRINLWPKVLPRPVENPADIRHQDFTFAGDADRIRVFINFAKALRERNPEAILIGSVWSPPAWMKHNNDINDKASAAIDGSSYRDRKTGEIHNNRLDMARLPHFAAWMVEYVRLFDAEGIPLDAVSIANEPQFTQRFESCLWTADDYAAAVRAVGEALEAAGYGHVKIFGPETMTGFHWEKDNPLFIRTLMQDPAVARHLHIFATHGYSDGFEADHSRDSAWRFWNLIKEHNRPYWVTEGGTGHHDWPGPVHGMAMSLHNALVHGNASGVVPWQIADVEADEGNLMHMGNPTAKTHVARHWFRFVRPGAVRVAATPIDARGVRASAFLHDGDGTLTVILINTSREAREVELSLPADVTSLSAVRTSAEERSAELPPIGVTDGRAPISLPGLSIVTLQGRE